MFVQETQLAQDTSLQESWPQACNIPGCPAARTIKTLLWLPRGSRSLAGRLLSSRAGGAADHPQTNRGGEAATAKQVEQLPQPCPARGPAVLQEHSPGHCGAEPRSPQPWAHPSPGLRTAPRGCSQLSKSAIVRLLLLLMRGCATHPASRHGSQQDEPGRGGTDEPAVSLAERVAQRGKGPELHPTAQWNSLLQDDRLN